MIVELHLIQNFAPANLNRDDTGSPKDCTFGGYRRARISSQSQKRAIRTLFAEEQLLPADALGERTKRLVEAIGVSLTAAGKDAEQASYVAGRILEALKIKMDSKRPDETSYLVFIGASEIARLSEIGSERWDELLAGFEPGNKKAKKPELPKDVATAARAAIDGRRAVDVALFGRMLADIPDRNRDAAAQVAHALSVNQVEVEFDFFTAVDDLKDRSQEDEDAGAGMLGTFEFNSACFYRYFNVDLGQLGRNLNYDAELTEAGLRAYLRAAVLALPTGKQNSFAAHQQPSLILSVVRDRGLQSLANAFVEPVRPDRSGNGDLVAKSVGALDAFLERQRVLYGDAVSTVRFAAVDPAYRERLARFEMQPNHELIPSLADLIDRTVAAALQG